MKPKPTLILATAALTVFAAAEAGAAGIIAYPKKGQSEAQQHKDKSACAQWATKQTGIDPEQLLEMQPSGQSAQSQAPGKDVARGAGKGAAVGAVGGAIGGNAGKGAAIGAGVGAAGGGLHNRSERKQAEKSQQAGQAQSQQMLAEYQKAQKTCLEGKGYSVD